MNDTAKTKEQLINELTVLRQRITELEEREIQHKQVEEELRQSKEKLHLTFDSLTEGITVTDLDAKIIETNQAAVRMHGYSSKKEIIGRSAFELIVQKDHAMAMENMKGTAGEGYARNIEYTFLTKDGCEFPAQLSAAILRDSSGNPVGFVAVTEDISERKQAEVALKRSEAQYRTLVGRLREGVYQTDLNGTYITLNDAGTRIFGFDSSDQVIGKYNTIDMYYDLSDRAKIVEEIGRTGFFVGEVRAKRRDGGVIWISVNNSRALDQEGHIVGYEGTFSDITERKQAEENERKLQQELSISSRLASIGELASGVAHEINNPLTAVIGFSQMLMARDIPKDAKDYLKIIDENAQRVANIVKNLLTFARQRKPGKERVDMNSLISRVVELRAYELKTHNIEVTTEFAPDLPSTMADGGQLQQVFLNIILNAEQAMMIAHNKGNLLIKTEGIGNTIRIFFKDDGPGIASENLEKLFHPFFTTKPVGEGTGLGLSLSYGIIGAHKGKIYAESTAGPGATFVVELPIVSSKQPELADPAVDEPGTITGARIMIVDDEPAICQLLSEVLSADGHNVETVDNADTALERLERQRYSLILLDVQMAGMDGIELYRHMGKIASSLQRRVVFITGDTMTPATQNFLRMAKVRCISKPFDTEQLKKEINQILLGKSR